MWTVAPLTFSLVQLPPSPIPQWKSIVYCTVYTYTVCRRGGGWGMGSGPQTDKHLPKSLGQTPAAKSLYRSCYVESLPEWLRMGWVSCSRRNIWSSSQSQTLARTSSPCSCPVTKKDLELKERKTSCRRNTLFKKVMGAGEGEPFWRRLKFHFPNLPLSACWLYSKWTTFTERVFNLSAA